MRKMELREIEERSLMGEPIEIDGKVSTIDVGPFLIDNVLGAGDACFSRQRCREGGALSE